MKSISEINKVKKVKIKKLIAFISIITLSIALASAFFQFNKPSETAQLNKLNQKITSLLDNITDLSQALQAPDFKNENMKQILELLNIFNDQRRLFTTTSNNKLSALTHLKDANKALETIYNKYFLNTSIYKATQDLDAIIEILENTDSDTVFQAAQEGLKDKGRDI